MQNKWATEAEITAINERVDHEVEDAVKFADESPYPDDDEMYKDVYLEEGYPFIVD